MTAAAGDTPLTAGQYDFAVRDVARAATAAPTYFPPALIADPEKRQRMLRHVPAGRLARGLAHIVNILDPDVIVLGCTHFPFLREEIQQHLPEGTRLIDSGEAIARRAVSLLQSIAPSSTHLNANEFLFTADTPSARKMAETLHLHGFAKVHLVANAITDFTQKHSAT